MTDKDYPNIFVTADSQSKKSQKRFVNLTLAILILIFLTTFSSTSRDFPNGVTLAASLLLVLSTLLTILIYFLKPEKTWYDGRAIAESAKSLTWKFMMGTSPFSNVLEPEQAEEKLIKNLKQIIGQKKEFYKLVGEQFGEGNQITPKMIENRQKPLNERVGIYAAERIEEQRKWYTKNSKDNRRYKNIAFACLVGFQVLAIVFLVMEIYETVSFTITPLLACLATSTIALLQLKRFQELTESYGITATELSLIKSKIRHIESEDDLQNFVDDAETAISREHTLWLARRDSVELFK